MKMRKSVVLIDCNIIFFRMFYASEPFLSNIGTDIAAVRGFMQIIYGVVNVLKPDHIVIAMDSAGSLRKEKYPSYKANRPALPEALVRQFPILYDAIRSMGLHLKAVDRYEADDIIASYVKHCGVSEDYVTIVSTDKDLMQLLHDGKVQMYDPFSKIYYNENAVQKKFGVWPKFILDYLALVGDSSDNIPGVKGIGSKTAVQLITSYGGIDRIYANIHGIAKPRLKNLLIEGHASAILSRELASLLHIESIESIDHYAFNGFNDNSIKEFHAKHAA